MTGPNFQVLSRDVLLILCGKSRYERDLGGLGAVEKGPTLGSILRLSP